MIEKTQEIIIDPHFCGPTQSGHGGYTAGIMAGHFEEGAEVTLRRPIPTGRPLKLFSQKTCVRLMDACEEIAIAIPKKVSVGNNRAPNVPFSKAGGDVLCLFSGAPVSEVLCLWDGQRRGRRF